MVVVSGLPLDDRQINPTRTWITNKRAMDVLEMSAFVGSCEKSHAIEVITTIEGLLIRSRRFQALLSYG